MFSLETAKAEVIGKCSVKDQGSPDAQAVENSLIRNALQVLERYDWTFLEVTGQVTTVVGQYEYTLTPDGAEAPECDRVLDVIYDVTATSKGLPLEYLDWPIARIDPTFFPAVATSGTRYTVKGKSDQGTPIIQLEWTPQTAGKVIDFRYKIKVDASNPFERFTPTLYSYIVDRTCAEFYPFPQKAETFRGQARDNLAAAQAVSVRKGNAIVRETLDPETKRENLEVNNLVSDRDLPYDFS